MRNSGVQIIYIVAQIFSDIGICCVSQNDYGVNLRRAELRRWNKLVCFASNGASPHILKSILFRILPRHQGCIWSLGANYKMNTKSSTRILQSLQSCSISSIFFSFPLITCFVSYFAYSSIANIICGIDELTALSLYSFIFLNFVLIRSCFHSGF